MLVRIPETVSSRFVLVPREGADPVRAARAGRVTAVAVAEGVSVAKGDTLFLIQSGTVGDQTAERAALQAQLAGAADALANARQRHGAERRASEDERQRLQDRLAQVRRQLESHHTVHEVREGQYQASLAIAEKERASLEAEIGFEREHASLAGEVATRHQRGYDEGFLSWIEYIRPQIDARKVAVDVEQLERQLEIARLKVSQLNAEHETQETDWRVALGQLETERRELGDSLQKLRHEGDARQAEYAELTRRLQEDTVKAALRRDALEEALTTARGAQLVATAPCAGSVLRLAVRAPQAVVEAGETLGEVACADGGLQAELMILPADVGRVSARQSVRLRYDAFPYGRYGVRTAMIRWVSPAAIGGTESPAFRALADLADATIRVDGQPRPLLAGMGGRADIVVGRRALIEYAFEPLRQLRENLGRGAGR